jgi:hypothetical protein
MYLIICHYLLFGRHCQEQCSNQIQIELQELKILHLPLPLTIMNVGMDAVA